MKPTAFVPRPWQLPHLLATPVGGTALIVERCEVQPPEAARSVCHDPIADTWTWNLAEGDGEGIGDCLLDVGDPFKCPLGPVGTVLAIKRRWIAGCIDAGIPKDIVCEGDPRFGLYEGGFKINPRRTCPREAWLLYRTTAIDLRRFESMTDDEATAWGSDTRKGKHFGQWLTDHQGSDLCDWAWFITAERVERA